MIVTGPWAVWPRITRGADELIADDDRYVPGTCSGGGDTGLAQRGTQEHPPPHPAA
jgi:hypothetical protein